MIEIIEIRMQANQRMARLSCTCEHPQLAASSCADWQLIFCRNCGQLTTPDRLRKSIPGGSAADLHFEELPATIHCPLVSVLLPAKVACGEKVSALRATVTKLSPEKIILRFNEKQPEADEAALGTEWLVCVEEESSSFEFHARVVESLRPQSAAATLYYELSIAQEATSARESLTMHYQRHCGLSKPAPGGDGNGRSAETHFPAAGRLLEAARNLSTEALARLCDTAQPFGSGTACSMSVDAEEFVRVLCMASETHDVNSSNHLKRIAAYCAAVAQRLGWSERRIAMLGTASKLHDIGKIGIADSILKKPDALTLEERKAMQQHTRLGHQMLQGSSSEVIRLGALIALRHHERVDGTGYPDRLGGEMIPIEAQMISLVDVFDALTTARAYKPAWTNQQAKDYLTEQSGKMFRPELVSAFMDVWLEIERNQLHFLDDFRDIWTERRTAVRHRSDQLPLQVEIAVPEQTFRPMRFNASMVNYSTHGMKVRVTGVDNDLFSMFIASRRYAKVTFPALVEEAAEGSFCAITWMDFHAVPDPQSCLMGMQFHKLSANHEALFEGLLQGAPALS